MEGLADIHLLLSSTLLCTSVGGKERKKKKKGGGERWCKTVFFPPSASRKFFDFCGSGSRAFLFFIPYLYIYTYNNPPPLTFYTRGRAGANFTNFGLFS